MGTGSGPLVPVPLSSRDPRPGSPSPNWKSGTPDLGKGGGDGGPTWEGTSGIPVPDPTWELGGMGTGAGMLDVSGAGTQAGRVWVTLPSLGLRQAGMLGPGMG